MNALHQSLMTSYAVSGADSVRLLLMTATPITVNPIELVQLMNLCKPIENQMPSTFELFSETYLNEDGSFSSKGEQKYLDDIAGHISYLNREKDARQFSQPIVKKVLVPIVTESQMKDVKDFDKFIAKTDSEAAVLQLQNELAKNTEKIEGELKEIDKNRFQYLKQICQEQDTIPQKKCNTIVNKRIAELVREVREYTKGIREQIKDIRTSIKDSNTNKRDALLAIQNKINENPELFQKYRTSTYAALRTACSSKSMTSRFSEVTKDIPQVAELDRQIQIDEERIAMMEQRAKIDVASFKLKLKQMKEMLRDPQWNDLERSVLESTIQISKKEFRKTQKTNSKKFKEEIDDIQKEIKETEKAKKKVFAKVRKTLKKIVANNKKDEKENQKKERELRKSQRAQGELMDEIQDEEVRVMAERKQVMIESDLKEIEEEEREKYAEKARKQKEKEVAKEEKQRAKESEKTRKAQEKLREQERKATEKEAKKNADKTRKAQEKLREQSEKEAKKNADKTRKAQEKLREQERKATEKMKKAQEKAATKKNRK
jgi:hypothetical protein